MSSAAKASSATGRPTNGSADSKDHSGGAVPGEALGQTVDTALTILSL